MRRLFLQPYDHLPALIHGFPSSSAKLEVLKRRTSRKRRERLRRFGGKGTRMISRRVFNCWGSFNANSIISTRGRVSNIERDRDRHARSVSNDS